MKPDQDGIAPLDAASAERYARVALANVGREYPFHFSHLAHGDADLAPPRRLHPLFGASYDWHSCVHMHWTLARCLRRHPTLPAAAAIRRHFDARCTAAAVAQELAYLDAPGRASFERPYGWGWLLKLQAELALLAPRLEAAAAWRDALAPLARRLAQRLLDHLPQMDFPVRTGGHGNTAFALLLALDHADACGEAPLRAAIAAHARRWFGADRDYPAAYEPSADDFLSAGLTEAWLMQRVLDEAAWDAWWQGFRPRPAALAGWLAPVDVRDARDPKIVHLHGLNLARAWCWRGLRAALPPALHPQIDAAVAAQLGCSLPAAGAGDYVGTHWLASFALLALDDAAAGAGGGGRPASLAESRSE